MILTNFISFKAQTAFTCFQTTLRKTPILYHFDPKYHIWIEMDVFSLAIYRV